MIPHLSADHCEDKAKQHNSPGSFVFQEIKVVSPQVDNATDL